MAVDRPDRSLSPAMFGPEVASVTEARHHLVNFLSDVPAEIRTVAALLVSELATNAIRHARTTFSLCADLTQHGLRVEVADGAAELPVIQHPRATEPRGRGLLIVSEMADSWGSQATPDGKLVWFELVLVDPEDVGQAGDL